MREQERMVEKLEEIGFFLVKIDEKILNIIDRYENLSLEQKEIKENLKTEIIEIRTRLDIFNLELNNYKIENLKLKNETELRDILQDNEIRKNDRFNSNVSRFSWLVVGAAIVLIVKYLF